jgi:lipopolysaccharide export system permease protein
VRLLERYLLRSLAAPLSFAFVALTGFMLLNQVARRFGDLAGKGLPWSVIGEVFALCIPFIIAMTLPMAVLVAVLYSVSHLAADNEITALRANGVSVVQILGPLFGAGVILAVINFGFTDQVLPRSNATLRNLLVNIQRKKPTFQLRDQVINEMGTSGTFLRAGRVDPLTGRLRNVTIYQLGAQDGRRVIYADSGKMAVTTDFKDLLLRLYDGSVHQYKTDQPSVFQLTYFRVNTIRVKDVSNQLDLNVQDNSRGDREMSSCELLDVVHQREADIEEADLQRTTLLRRDLRLLTGLAADRRADQVPPVRETGYCKLFRQIGDVLFPQTLKAQTPAQPKPPGWLGDSVRRLLSKTGTAPAPSSAWDEERGPASHLRLSSWNDISAALDNRRSADHSADQYAVEFHKKWAISASCIVFVLVGIPMALRFPRAGMGLVIGGGMSIFAFYYVCLIAGEGLGDRGVVTPLMAMWAPNLFMAVLGLFGLYRVNRESGSTRGGDVADLVEMLFGRFRRGSAR